MPWGGGQPDACQLTAAIENCKGVRELARILHEQKRALKHVHVSAAWVHLAGNGTVWGEGDVREAVVALQDRTWGVLDRADGRGVANVMHSMAKLKQMGVRVDQKLRLAMQKRAIAKATELTPQAVSNLLWALATMGVRADRALMEAIRNQATATAEEFKPQNVTNVLWALATMGEVADLELLDAMKRRATATAADFNPHEVAIVLWALFKMGKRADRGLLEALTGRAPATVWECTPQGVVNML